MLATEPRPTARKDYRATAADPSYKRLAAAIVLLAVHDAAGLGLVTPMDTAGAAAWLTSSAGAELCELAGLDSRAVSAWVIAGCPAAPILAADNRKRKGVA